MKKNEVTKCSTCRRDQTVVITDHESGEIICGNCGIVITENSISQGLEWHSFDVGEFNHLVTAGAPASPAGYYTGLSTFIGKTDKDARGQNIDLTVRSTMERLRVWDLRTKFYYSPDRSLREAFTQLNIIKDKLGLSNTAVEKTTYIYRKAQKRKLAHGRTISSLLSAAIYAACREMGIPRTLEDIAEISNINRKEIARMYRILVFELDLKIPLVDLMKCIIRIANKANLSEKAKYQAISLMNTIIKKGISAGKGPMGLAATILYMSCLDIGEDITQTRIAVSAGVTEVTIRNRFRDLKTRLNLK